MCWRKSSHEIYTLHGPFLQWNEQTCPMFGGKPKPKIPHSDGPGIQMRTRSITQVLFVSGRPTSRARSHRHISFPLSAAHARYREPTPIATRSLLSSVPIRNDMIALPPWNLFVSPKPYVPNHLTH